MMRRWNLTLALLIAAAALPLHAQGGCIDSPEDPTVVLALLGGISAAALSLRAARGQKK
jgi:XrtJ-associated TM-motif-TM protein